jgi:hypothetical protein
MKHSAECWRGNYKEGAELIEPEASGVSGMKIEGEEDGQEYRRIDEIFESPPLDGDGDLLHGGLDHLLALFSQGGPAETNLPWSAPRSGAKSRWQPLGAFRSARKR